MLAVGLDCGDHVLGLGMECTVGMPLVFSMSSSATLNPHMASRMHQHLSCVDKQCCHTPGELLGLCLKLIVAGTASTVTKLWMQLARELQKRLELEHVENGQSMGNHVNVLEVVEMVPKQAGSECVIALVAGNEKEQDSTRQVEQTQVAEIVVAGLD